MFCRRLLTKSVPCISISLNYSSFNCTKALNVTKFPELLERPASLTILTDSLQPTCILNKRFKSYEKRSKKDKDSDDEEEFKDDSHDKSLSKDSKVIIINVTAMRIDSILKSGLNISRNKIETLFYESKLRINGKKLLKKSSRVKEGDELDVIKSFSPNNPEHLIISRLEVLNAVAEDEEIAVTLRRYKTLLIENYEDPYKAATPTDLS